MSTRISRLGLEDEQWRSYWMILKPLLQHVHVRRAVELGAGKFSTRNLAKMVDELISIETEEVWVKTMSEETKDLKDLQIVLREGPNLAPYLHEYNTNLDLLFVDHSGDRWKTVEEGMRLRIPYIVMHDFTEESENSITISNGYHLFATTVVHFNPTALYTNNNFVWKTFNTARDNEIRRTQK